MQRGRKRNKSNALQNRPNIRFLRKRKRIDKMIKSYILSRDGNEQLTKHFKVKEFACKDGSPVVFIDEYLYEILEILRNKLGKPVIITSGYRTPEWNEKCNGAKYIS